MSQNGEKCGEIGKSHFSKITESAPCEPTQKATYSEHPIAVHSISMAGYVATVLAFVHDELLAREASSFCDF